MDIITEYLNTLTAQELRQVRRSLYRALRFSHNPKWSVLLQHIDTCIMQNAFARCEQSDTNKES